MATSSAPDVFAAIALAAERESRLWRAALLRAGERELVPVFSPLGEPRFALGLETIYEGYLVHYGRSRLFAPGDRDTALLLGDYLYAHGLVRVAELGDVDAIATLAELIAECAHLRAEALPGDGEAWARAAAALGTAPPPDAAARDRALASHADRLR